MNNVTSMIKSLRRTLHTVPVQAVPSLRWSSLPKPPQSAAKVRGRFQRGALIAWCFHPAQEKQRSEKTQTSQQQRQRDAAGRPAYVLAAVDKLVNGYHSVFILVHLLLETRGRTWWKTVSRLLRPTFEAPASHLPERTPLHADVACLLWGLGTCIFPSCRRWPSWCPASPAVHRKKGSIHRDEVQINSAFTPNWKQCKYTCVSYASHLEPTTSAVTLLPLMSMDIVVLKD